MTLLSRLIGRLAKLPRAQTHAVIVERNLKIPLPDCVVLLADCYVPQSRECPPTILVRCPYGRGFFVLLYGRLFAERGFQVLVQSTRGTFGSGGRMATSTTMAWQLLPGSSSSPGSPGCL